MKRKVPGSGKKVEEESEDDFFLDESEEDEQLPACPDASMNGEEDDDEEEDEQDEEEEEDEEDEEEEEAEVGSGSHGKIGSGEAAGQKKKKVKGPLTLKSVKEFQAKEDRTGVVYLSRVPPYMKPEKIRHLLQRHADVGRVFLTPEDPAVRKKRKALDLWNLKYLSGFKWRHLTEKISYDNTVRRQKLQAEIAQAKREKDFYMERVDQHKKIVGKAKKLKAAAPEGGDGDGVGVLRTFRQTQSVGTAQAQGEGAPKKVPNTALLSRIFGKKS